mgnify:CR=1 FL=1
MSDSGWQVLDFSDFKASISGSVRVEPQHGGMSERHIYFGTILIFIDMDISPHVRKHEDGSEVDVPLAHAAVVIKEATFGGQSVSESPV